MKWDWKDRKKKENSFECGNVEDFINIILNNILKNCIVIILKNIADLQEIYKLLAFKINIEFEIRTNICWNQFLRIGGFWKISAGKRPRYDCT